MDRLGVILLLTALYPMGRLWRFAGGTTLRHAVAWAMAAWLAWEVAWLRGGTGWRYFALCLAGCAGVAVLGARRPGAGAWNFVVAGLLLVLCRPYLDGFGTLRLEPANLIFLGLVLAVGVGNYLPTRGGLAAALFAGWCGVELGVLAGLVDTAPGVMPLTLATVPWLALILMSRSKGQPHEVDRAWRSFRDAFGFLWAQRVRDQFNRAAANADLNVELTWAGLRGEGNEQALTLLRSVLQRFHSTKG